MYRRELAECSFVHRSQRPSQEMIVQGKMRLEVFISQLSWLTGHGLAGATPTQQTFLRRTSTGGAPVARARGISPTRVGYHSPNGKEEAADVRRTNHFVQTRSITILLSISCPHAHDMYPCKPKPYPGSRIPRAPTAEPMRPVGSSSPHQIRSDRCSTDAKTMLRIPTNDDKKPRQEPFLIGDR